MGAGGYSGAAPDGVLDRGHRAPPGGRGAQIAALGLALIPEQLLDSPHALIARVGRVGERLAELRERWGFGALTVYEADPALRPPGFPSLGA
ncbi:MAG: hypothetical protein JOY78_08840 [Pseudonocardia sp.]|nr:hypothetical protein [Pseudonocardia sp.]